MWQRGEKARKELQLAQAARSEVRYEFAIIQSSWLMVGRLYLLSDSRAGHVLCFAVYSSTLHFYSALPSEVLPSCAHRQISSTMQLHAL